MSQTNERKKTTCTLTQAAFEGMAIPLTVTFDTKDGRTHVKDVEVKLFSSGSFGWYFAGKVEVVVTNEDGSTMKVPVQVGLNMVVVGSKEAPRE